MTPQRNSTLAALLAAGLAFAAAPATAQPFDNAFGLHFGWGDRWHNSYEPRGPALAICKTDRQIRQAIAGRGYSNISLNVRGDRRVQVRATMDGATWLLDYDFCNDTIIERRFLR